MKPTSDINRELEKQSAKAFTGHIKFGIEKSAIVSMTVNSRLEKSENENAHFDKQLMDLCSNTEFYGSIEVDMVLGEIKRLNYCMSYNGAGLKKELGLLDAKM